MYKQNVININAEAIFLSRRNNKPLTANSRNINMPGGNIKVLYINFIK